MSVFHTDHFRHCSVLLQPAVEALCAADHGGQLRFVDCTLGGGGHSAALLERCPGAQLVGIDRDPEALAAARRRLGDDHFQALAGNFAELGELLASTGSEPGTFDGILWDFGVSSHQIDSAERGFSFQQDGPLDMRMDPQSGGPSAAELLHSLEPSRLEWILREYGEERHASLLARKLVEEREKRALDSTAELADLVSRVLGRWYRGQQIHPATRCFQALRIAVNDELGAIERSLRQALHWLRPGGRLVAISFHSLEDRIVKQFMQAGARRCNCPPEFPQCQCTGRPVLRLINRKPIRPDQVEIQANPRARSARMRVASKC